MKQRKLITIVSIIVLLIIIGLAFYFRNNENIIKKNQKYTFDEYELLSNNANLLSNQNTVDDEITKEIKNGNYTIKNPYVKANPYKISPLTAIIGFNTTNKVSIKVTVKAKNGGKDLVYQTKENTNHYVPIYGLYADYENEIILEAGKETNTIKIPVEKSAVLNYVYFPDVTIKLNNLDKDDNDFYFMSTPLGELNMAFDQSGEIRWVLTNSVYKQVTILKNGHFLLSSPENMENKSLGMIEIDALGRIYNSYELTNPYLSNYVQTPDENIIYSSVNDKNEDLIINMSSKGKVLKSYNLYEMFSKIDSSFMKTIKDKFQTINSLDYDEKNDAIIVGIYYYSTIISIDYKSGDINWILADPSYYSSSFSKYLLKAEDNFKYPKGNYNATLNNNVLSLMNNNWDQTLTFSCNVTGLKSSANQYTIDQAKKTISQKSSFGTDKNLFSYTFGDYQIKEKEQNIMYGRIFRGFHADMSTCNLSEEGDFYSEIITLKDNKEVFIMDVSNSYNSLNKMSIIDKNYAFNASNANVYVADQASDKYTTKEYTEKLSDLKMYSIPLTLEGNKLSLSINETEYKVVLLAEDGTEYIYEPSKDNSVNIKKGFGNMLVLFEKDNILYNTGYYLGE